MVRNNLDGDERTEASENDSMHSVRTEICICTAIPKWILQEIPELNYSSKSLHRNWTD